jgi:hypothetical protein
MRGQTQKVCPSEQEINFDQTPDPTSPEPQTKRAHPKSISEYEMVARASHVRFTPQGTNLSSNSIDDGPTTLPGHAAPPLLLPTPRPRAPFFPAAVIGRAPLKDSVLQSLAQNRIFPSWCVTMIPLAASAE